MDDSVSAAACEKWTRSTLKKLALSKPSPDQVQKVLTLATTALYEGFSYLESFTGGREGTARTERTDQSVPQRNRWKYLQTFRLLVLEARKTEHLTLPQICSVLHLACQLLRCQLCGRLLLQEAGSDVLRQRSRSCPKSTASFFPGQRTDAKRVLHSPPTFLASSSQACAPLWPPPCEACTFKNERVQSTQRCSGVSTQSVFCNVLVCVAVSLRTVLQLGVFPALLPPCTSNAGLLPDARNKMAAEAVQEILVASDKESREEWAVRFSRIPHASSTSLCVDLWSYLRQSILIHTILDSDLSVENDILYPMFCCWLRLEANGADSKAQAYVDKLWTVWMRCFFASVSRALCPPRLAGQQIQTPLWSALAEQINIVSNVIRALRSSGSHQERLRYVLKTWMHHFVAENCIQSMTWPLRNPACVFQTPTDRSGALKWLRHFLGFFPCIPSNAFPSKQTVVTTIYASVAEWLITFSNLVQDTRPATRLRLPLDKNEACDTQESENSTFFLNIDCDLDELTVELQVLIVISDQLISAVSELEEWSPLLAAKPFAVDAFQRKRWILLLKRISQWEEHLVALVDLVETHQIFKTLWLERVLHVQKGSDVEPGLSKSTLSPVLLRYLLPKLRLCVSELWVGRMRRRVLALCMATYRVLSRLRKDVLAAASERTSSLQNHSEKQLYVTAPHGGCTSFAKLSRDWAVDIINSFETVSAKSLSAVGSEIGLSQRRPCTPNSQTDS